jgi:hypothetical protein
MDIKQLLTVVTIATAIFWTVWASVLNKIDPFNAEVFGFLLFYLTIFFALLGTLFLISFFYRKIFSKFSIEFNIVGISFRQSFFLSLLAVSLLILQGVRALNIINSLLLVAVIVVIEFFFLSYKKRL